MLQVTQMKELEKKTQNGFKVMRKNAEPSNVYAVVQRSVMLIKFYILMETVRCGVVCCNGFMNKFSTLAHISHDPLFHSNHFISFHSKFTALCFIPHLTALDLFNVAAVVMAAQRVYILQILHILHYISLHCRAYNSIMYCSTVQFLFYSHFSLLVGIDVHFMFDLNVLIRYDITSFFPLSVLHSFTTSKNELHELFPSYSDGFCW